MALSTQLTRRVLLAAALVAAAPLTAHAKSAEIYTGLLSSTAVGGYDPVAYFTEGKPVAGKSGITHSWKGVTWRFASEKNRDLFKAKPENTRRNMAATAPGPCRRATPRRATRTTGRSSTASSILNYDANVQRNWEKDIPGHIGNANRNWPKVLEK